MNASGDAAGGLWMVQAVIQPFKLDPLTRALEAAVAGRLAADTLDRRERSERSPGLPIAAIRCVLTVMLVAAIAVCTGSDPGYRGRSSREWIGLLSSPDRVVRADAAIALSHVLRLNPRVPGVAEAMVAALADSADEIRLIAGNALASEGVHIPSAVPPLVAMLGDQAHAQVRKEAARILGTFGAVAQPAVHAFVVVLGDPDPYVRAAAVHALGQIGPTAAPALPALERLVDDPAALVRGEVLDALARVEPTGHDALPLLIGALQDSMSMVRTAAVVAIGSLQTRALPAVEALVARLSDPHAGVRAAAAFAIGRIGPSAVAAIPALTAVIRRDTSAYVVSEADDAVAAITGRPRPRRPPPEPARRTPDQAR